MKILFVEDTDFWIKHFKPELEKLGDVTHFKSSNKARREMHKTKFDLIVCDHCILRFEEGRDQATGDEVYGELRELLDDEETPFIHFSSSPCNKEYDGWEEDKNFYCLRKDYDNQLIELIRDLM